MSKLNRSLIAAFTILLLSCPLLIQAQELAATLNGKVTDPSGAVIPNAKVTIVQNAVKGLSRTTQTNASGSFTVTNLASGNYTLTVTAKGFQAYTVRNLTLFVSQTRSVTAKLQPGAVSQTVTVQANSAVLDTTTSALAGTISGKQVRELQLNNRNFIQLTTLQPGVVSQLPDASAGLSHHTSISVNGVRSTANNFTVDGADNNDSGSNSNMLNIPSIDAIQEFTMERSTYDAGFGRSGGGQILLATKSGTSAFHGDAYEFARNNIFNANSYFNNRAGLPRAIQRYNDFGFTIGGPLYIPRLYNTAKNKTFFFWSEEWRKTSVPVTSSLLSPTQNELNGIFAGLITDAPPGCVAYDASTNQSTINPNCYSQNSKVYLANMYSKFPANSDGRYVQSYSARNDTHQDLVRFDWNVAQNLHFFARGIRDEYPVVAPEGLFDATNYIGVAGVNTNTPDYNLVGNLTWIVSPRMTNELEFAFTQGTEPSTFLPNQIGNSQTVSQALTNKTSYQDPYGRIPALSFTGGTIQGINYSSAPYNERNLDRTLFDNFAVTLGRHTLRAGATVSQMLKSENAGNGYANFRFNSFQDFLLGNVAQYSQDSRDIKPDLHYVNLEWFAQDDWQVTRKLTLNLGLRYSYFPSPTDILNTLNNFSPLVYDASKAPAIDPATGNFVEGQGQIPATYVNGIIFPAGKACSQAQAIAPGVTCSPYGKSVNPNPKTDFAPRVGFAFVPYGAGEVVVRGGFGIFYDRTLNGIFEQNAFSAPPLVQTATYNNTSFDDPLQGSSSVSLAPNSFDATGNPTMKTPSYMDYNLTVQEQLMPSTLLEIAYVGSLGRHLLGDRDINQPTLGARSANPSAAVTAVMPYRGFGAITDRATAFNSNYNALQVSLNHRAQNGLTLGVAYTWSKLLGNQSVDRGVGSYNTYNPSLDYGPSTYNQPQTFVVNYVYDLPFYKQQHGIAGHLLGGWEASGITEIESGQSFTVTQASDNFDCVTPPGATSGCLTGTYPGGLYMDNDTVTPRPDQIASPHLTKKVAQWFTTNSFADAIGHFGDAHVGNLLGPGVINFDISAMKNVKINEDVNFQFRAEFFNAFNHTNFEAVDSNIDHATFGQITSAHDPRTIQFGGKIYW